jgi:hypothetical protein
MSLTEKHVLGRISHIQRGHKSGISTMTLLTGIQSTCYLQLLAFGRNGKQDI